MKTLFVSYSPHLGGAERLLLDVATALPGPAVVASPPGQLAAAAAERGLARVALRERRLEVRASARDRLLAAPRLAAHAIEVRGAIGREHPQLVVGWSMRSALAVSAALMTMRSRPAFVFHHNDFVPQGSIARAVRAAARRADRVVATSTAIARDLDPLGVLDGRLVVVHPGVDLERFTAGPFATGPPEVLTLGAIVDWKRPELALEAVAIAARTRPELRLVIAGAPLGRAGELLLQRLRRRAERVDLRGRIAFAGPLADVAGALGRAACLLHASEREPFGIALVEALACGRPVVAAAAGGPLEIVDETCGRLYEPGSAAAAAEALLAVLDDVESLGQAGRRRVEREFDARVARARWVEVAQAAVGSATSA